MTSRYRKIFYYDWPLFSRWRGWSLTCPPCWIVTTYVITRSTKPSTTRKAALARNRSKQWSQWYSRSFGTSLLYRSSDCTNITSRTFSPSTTLSTSRHSKSAVFNLDAATVVMYHCCRSRSFLVNVHHYCTKLYNVQNKSFYTLANNYEYSSLYSFVQNNQLI